MKNNLRILVTGAGGDLGRAMIYYLNKFDFEIFAADSNEDLLCAPHTIKRFVLPRADQKNYIPALNMVIVKNEINLLIVQSDKEIREISKDTGKIKTRVWLPRHEAVARMQDKFACNKIWESAGIPIPQSVIVKSPRDLRGSVWLRPLGYIGGGGKMAFHAKTKKEAVGWVEGHNGWGKFTANEYLPGTIFGFDSLWQKGELVGWSIKERIRSVHEGGGTTAVRTSTDSRVRKTAIRAITAVQAKPDGAFSVDMRENKKGIPCVTEINPGRFLTTSLLLFRELDYDLPLDYIRIALGERVGKRPSNKKKKYLFFVKGMTRLLDEKDMRIEKL